MIRDFIWDLGKEAVNIRKHRIDFSLAAQAFDDPHRRIVLDHKHSMDEQRMFCVGLARGKVMTVRFVYRRDKVRILGAGYWRKGAKLYAQKKSI